MKSNKQKVAIILRGGVGKSCGKLGHTSTDLYSDYPYINYFSVKDSIYRHIIDSNPNYEFDFFIHCWNEDLKDSLVELYQPKKYLFESNTPYVEEINKKLNASNRDQKCFGEVSVALSIAKGCELVEEYGEKYNKIISARPDYLYWRDMNLDEYDNDKVYGTQLVQNHTNLDGESHYVMSYENIHLLKSLYSSIGPSNPPDCHIFVKRHIISAFGSLYTDKFYTGRDHESVRKLKYNINDGTLRKEQLPGYGLTLEEIFSYNPD